MAVDDGWLIVDFPSMMNDYFCLKEVLYFFFTQHIIKPG
jgi:hypothetical protein